MSTVVGGVTVMRGQRFGGHTLGDGRRGGRVRGAADRAYPLAGFIGLGIADAGVMDLIGVYRVWGRDLAIGCARLTNQHRLWPATEAPADQAMTLCCIAVCDLACCRRGPSPAPRGFKSGCAALRRREPVAGSTVTYVSAR